MPDKKCLFDCYPPKAPCPYAQKMIERVSAGGTEYNRHKKKKDACEWYILSPENHYCFWLWHNHLENKRTYTLEEVEALLGLPIGTIWHLERRALEKVKKAWGRFRDKNSTPPEVST